MGTQVYAYNYYTIISYNISSRNEQILVVWDCDNQYMWKLFQ